MYRSEVLLPHFNVVIRNLNLKKICILNYMGFETVTALFSLCLNKILNTFCWAYCPLCFKQYCIMILLWHESCTVTDKSKFLHLQNCM